MCGYLFLEEYPKTLLMIMNLLTHAISLLALRESVFNGTQIIFFFSKIILNIFLERLFF